MPLESATYLDDLNSANPAATDLLSQGDDHIRLIKAVLQATFPNLTGAVTSTQAELNLLDGALSVGVPTGSIVLWYGTNLTVPTGYGICNGSIYAKSDGSGNITSPDLRDKVVIGAGTVVAQGATNGAATASATSGTGGAHTHSISGGGHSHPGLVVAGHALAESEMPAHSHKLAAPGISNTVFSAEASIAGEKDTNGDSDYRLTSAAGAATYGKSSTTGGGTAHTHDLTWPATADGTHSHTISSDGDHTHGVTVSTYQPALALHYIMKL